MATEPERRSERPREKERERDLPFPKRPVADAEMFGFSPPRMQTGMTMPGDNLKKIASAASRPQVLVPRLTPALLRDLPTAVGASPRRAVRARAAVAAGAGVVPISHGDIEMPRLPLPKSASEPRLAALPRQSRPDLAVVSPVAAPGLPITAGPSDRTTPDTPDAPEPRLTAAAPQASKSSPAHLPVPPGPAMAELLDLAPATLPPDVAELAVSSPALAPVAAKTPQPPAPQTRTPTPAAAATPATQASAPSGPKPALPPPEPTVRLAALPAPSPQTVPPPDGAEPSGGVPAESVPAAPADGVETSPSQVDLGDPPHLPMGWIIGALFVLALLLTLWIANRAGVFGPPAGGAPIEQPTAIPPRMP